MLVVKAHFLNVKFLKDIYQTEAQTPVVFLVRNPFDAIVAERTRDLRSKATKYWNDTHISSDIHESQFGEFQKARLLYTFLHEWNV